MMAHTIALVANDGKKMDLVNFVQQHKLTFGDYHLVATKNTGQLIQEVTDLPVQLVLSGSMGGDAQIASLVATGSVNAVFFLVDPLKAHAHQVDIYCLQRICTVYNVPLALNLATSEVLVTWLVKQKIANTLFLNLNPQLKLVEKTLSNKSKRIHSRG